MALKESINLSSAVVLPIECSRKLLGLQRGPFWGGGVKSLCSEGFERGSDWAKLTGRLALPAFGRPGIEPTTCMSAVGCITIRSLLVLRVVALPTACRRVRH